MSFTEASTVETLIRDLLCGGVNHHTTVGAGLTHRSGKLAGLGWCYLAPPNIPRQIHEVFVEDWIRDALIRLNPEIAVLPERADEVLYKLRAIVLAVRSDGLLKANEELTAWLRGDRSMPFGPNHEHVTVRLLDFENVENNQYVVTSQFTFRAGLMVFAAQKLRLEPKLGNPGRRSHCNSGSRCRVARSSSGPRGGRRERRRRESSQPASRPTTSRGP